MPRQRHWKSQHIAARRRFNILCRAILKFVIPTGGLREVLAKNVRTPRYSLFAAIGGTAVIALRALSVVS
jgi:hypothetical protein